jgi:two-component system sensor histidine kinase TctE
MAEHPMLDATEKPSLRRRLARQVLVPLAVTWLLGTILVVGVANYFVGRAYDRALLDDAYALAAKANVGGGEAFSTLNARDLAAVLFDQAEQNFFAIYAMDGKLVAGQPSLLRATGDISKPAYFDTTELDGRSVRRVTLAVIDGTPYIVVMAQTLTSRTRLLERLIAFAIVPQIALLIGLAIWLRRTIREELQPLDDLQRAMSTRDARDLTPLTTPTETRDLQRLTDAVNALLGRISRGVAAQREFSGNVAHELRTPLAGIRALAEYGLKQRESEVWRKQLESILRSEQRATHLVDQLLALAMADEATNGLPLAELGLDALCREVLMEYLSRAELAGADIGADGIDHPVTVIGHPSLIVGLLTNLIDNALRYGKPSDGTQPAITVYVRTREGAVELGVADNGPGLIDGERFAMIERWTQGALGQELGQGAGLGLAIVARYSRLMNARLIFSRSPQGGADICVRFPTIATMTTHEVGR